MSPIHSPHSARAQRPCRGRPSGADRGFDVSSLTPAAPLDNSWTERSSPKLGKSICFPPPTDVQRWDRALSSASQNIRARSRQPIDGTLQTVTVGVVIPFRQWPEPCTNAVGRRSEDSRAVGCPAYARGVPQTSMAIGRFSWTTLIAFFRAERWGNPRSAPHPGHARRGGHRYACVRQTALCPLPTERDVTIRSNQEGSTILSLPASRTAG